MSLIPCLPPFHIHSISYRGWTSLLNFRFREWFEFAPWLSNSLHVEFSYILDMLVSECLSPARQSKNWYRQIYFSVMNYHPIQRVKAMTSRNSISTFLLLFINMYFWIQWGFQVSLQFCTSEYTWFISS